MKKHIYIAFLFCIVSLTGCDNFLTVESPDFSTDKFWRDSVDVESGLSAAYGQLDNIAGSYNFAEIKFVVETFREDIMNIGADVNNYPEWGPMCRAERSQVIQVLSSQKFRARHSSG